MQVFSNIKDIRLSGQTYLTIGNFDGLHRGHQALLRQLLDLAHTQPGSAYSALVTFNPHPLTLLRPNKSLQLLTTPQERLRLAGEIGIDIGLIQPFTPEFAALSPLEFMTLLKEHMGLVGLVVGPDFALGRDRKGDLATLRDIGSKLDYSVNIIEPIAWQDRMVRSSVIRQDIRSGDVSEARELLGRYYTLEGLVQVGDRRGHTIGVPTANIKPPAGVLLPGDGVYATVSTVDPEGQALTFNSVTNIGVRPTVDGRDHRVETHLLDFPPSEQSATLYGETIRIEFAKRLRGERRFDSVEALVAQIRYDIKQARRIFGTMPGHGKMPANDTDGN